MDLNDLKSQVSNLTLYDLKAGFRKAQNGNLSLETTTGLAVANVCHSGDELYRYGGEGAFGASLTGWNL